MNIINYLLRKSTPSALEQRQPPIFDAFNLDIQLLHLSPVDTWTIRDACEGVQIFGAIGSGKTSGSGAALAKAFLNAGFGGLVMCAKPEERQLWEHYAKETGRENHLVIFSPDHAWRFNWLNYELRRAGKGSGQTENLVNLFSHITEIVEGRVEPGGGDAFWPRAMRELLRNTIDILSLAKGELTLEDICTLIAEAPQSVEDVGPLLNPAEAEAIGYTPTASVIKWWNTSFCAACIGDAGQKEKTPREAHDFEVSTRYFLRTYPNLSDRTRSGIVASFTGVADMLLHGFVWELFCTETNLVPEVTYQDGAIIVLDIPIQEYHDVGRIAQGIFKFLFQRAILRRDANQYPRPVFLWADEAQNFVSSFDYQYQAVARSARACTAYLTQNINNYYSVLGSKSESDVNALLGNFQTKIFHANSDRATNQFAADMISQEETTTYSYNSSASFDGSRGGSQSAGGSDTIRYKVLPAVFTTLRKGGPANGLQVDSIIFQGGRVWNATGDTYLKAVFKQA